ncbi:MAG: DNA helicase PcrA [Clostridia bacterium]|nr:DNA helicase PcrA [Clostridia bacterium]
MLENLNPKQREAAAHIDGPLLILAGAGSGKTRVLTHRIAYLIYKGIPKENILAITFTNKAAEEMKERLVKLIGVGARDIWTSTFHSTCVRILRRNINFLGYKRNFVIYDSVDQRNLIKDVLKLLDLDEKRFPIRRMQDAISKAKNNLYTPEMYAAEVSGFFDAKVAEVYSQYQEKLVENNALDFDDLLMQTVYLFSKNSEILEYYQKRFKYILVDEYQDTNYAQYMLVKLLSEKHRNLCVVGDDDQSIYGWRGADIKNILDFETDYPEAKVIKLEQNYRSSRNILQAASEVVKNNLGRKEKLLWTDGPPGEKIKVYLADNEKEEARFLAKEIAKFRQKNGKKLGEAAVLYRTNAQSRVIEEAFVFNNIPYNIVGTLKFYERKEIKDIIAYLRVLVNPYDNLSFARIINVPRRGIGPVTWGKIQGYAMEKNIPIMDALLEVELMENIGRSKKTIMEFGQMMKDFVEKKDRVGVTNLTLDILEGTGYTVQLEQEDTEESRGRLDNIKEFLSVTQEYDSKNRDGSLEEFLEGVALISDADTHSSEADRVVMMTLHTAKGLEFPVVFITGMEEGIFPHSRSLNSEPEIEEERRLCYVGMTRARERLYLTHAKQRTLYGETLYGGISRFIKEIPEELLEFSDTPSYLMDGEGEQGDKGKQENIYSVGDRVYHEKWGEGMVVRVGGPPEGDIISVAFKDQGIKQLLLEFAPIKRL